jgi:hypothetical protein
VISTNENSYHIHNGHSNTSISLSAVNCPTGMVFKEKTSACQATCETPDGPEKCKYPDTENCVCPDDMVLINGTCRKPEMCKCPGGYDVSDGLAS